MGFILTEEQKELRNMVKSFMETEVMPIVPEYDEKGECPVEIVKKGLEMGFHMLEVPEEYGGAGLDTKTAIIVQEEMAKVDCGFAGCFSVTAMAIKCILRMGTEEQKKHFIKRFTEGRMMGAFCLTEQSAGSDAASIRTTAVRDGDDYILNGVKTFITNGGVSDTYIVMAVTDKTKGTKGISAFVVEREREGVSVGKEENKMGFRLSNTTEVILDNVRVPAFNRLGEEGLGFVTAMKALDDGRLFVAAGAVGIAQRALEEAVKYSKQRICFKQPIHKFQGIQFMIADMAMQLEAGRQLINHAVDLKEAGLPFSKEAAMAKCFCTDTVMKVTSDAIQIFGGYGYCKEYPVEKLLRDAKINQIFEGTNQIQRMVIGNAVVAEY